MEMPNAMMIMLHKEGRRNFRTVTDRLVVTSFTKSSPNNGTVGRNFSYLFSLSITVHNDIVRKKKHFQNTH